MICSFLFHYRIFIAAISHIRLSSITSLNIPYRINLNVDAPFVFRLSLFFNYAWQTLYLMCISGKRGRDETDSQ